MNMYMYNFRTGEHDYLAAPPDWSDYIPQHPPAQNLYRLYLEMGDEPLDAALKVLGLATQTGVGDE